MPELSSVLWPLASALTYPRLPNPPLAKQIPLSLLHAAWLRCSFLAFPIFFVFRVFRGFCPGPLETMCTIRVSATAAQKNALAAMCQGIGKSVSARPVSRRSRMCRPPPSTGDAV